MLVQRGASNYRRVRATYTTTLAAAKSRGIYSAGVSVARGSCHFIEIPEREGMGRRSTERCGGVGKGEEREGGGGGGSGVVVGGQ